jgi:hypothetical protein
LAGGADPSFESEVSEKMETEKSPSEICTEYYEAVCKSRGWTLEEFFKRNPGEYEKYRKLTTVSIGSRIKDSE